jgi:2-iminobutanoate/2-iminopropanoate deaminase
MEACFERMSKTLESAGASLNDMVQINLYLRNMDDFRPARDVFFKYFKSGYPARMATTTEFVDSSCLCMLDGIAYKKGVSSED